jgi:hypothetical protein
MARATAQLKVEEVAEAALPPLEACCEDTLDSDLEEDWPGCNHNFDEYPEVKGRCCVITTMASQQDFQEQRGRLQELEATGQIVIYYPKFLY